MSNGVNPSPSVANSTIAQTADDPIRAALNDFVVWSQDSPAWQRDALRRLYAQSKLASAEAQELFTLCRQVHNLLESGETALTPIPLDVTHVPSSWNTGGAVALKSIGCAQNVNALAEDQYLQFAESGLTIVYGDNGSGKSGYGRVLKRACRARDQEEILPNAYVASTGKPAARIGYFVDGVIQPEVAWHDGAATDARLSNISVFDSKCASIHVDGKNELAYTPAPLQLLQALADACRDLGARLKAKKAVLEAQVPAFKKKPASREGTAVHNALLNLSATTETAAIDALAQMSEEEKLRLEQLKGDLAADPVKEVRKLTAQKQRIEQLIVAGATSDLVLLPATADGFRELLTAARDRATAAHIAATEAFRKEPLPQAGSDVWKTLWEAARAFSIQEAYRGEAFPNPDPSALCVLCQQSLSPAAAARLQNFEAFVQQRVQQVADDTKRALERRKDEIQQSCASDESLREAVRLLRDDVDQREVCNTVIRNLTRARVRGRKFIAATDPRLIRQYQAGSEIAVKLRPLVTGLDERIAELQRTSDPEQRKLQESELRGLEDRVWLESILLDVHTEIERLKKIVDYGRAIDDTDTSRITRKTTEVSRALVTNTIRDAFAAEIVALNMADRRLELTQEPSGYGSTKFKVSLIRNPTARVAGILSEGEHRCVALAAFLGELSTANNRSSVIFDDPVSSLDHNYREAFAVRLAKEAASGRQVVVFTHDIPFLMMLDEEARALRQAPFYQCVNRATDLAGICASEAPLKAQTVPEIVRKVEKRLTDSKALHATGRQGEWADQVKAMAGILRDGWERATEAFVAPTIRRFGNKVHPGGLRQLTVLTDQDFSDLSDGYEFASINCHTDSPELNRPAPTPQKIDEEIKRLQSWFESIRLRQDKMK
jgi:energy-coupling factor transporter ATP-binding protein EcfA2